MTGAHIGDGFKPDKFKTHDHQADERVALLPEDVAETGAIDFYESVISDTNDEDDNEDVKWLREQRLHFKLLKWYERPSVYMMGAFLFLYSVSQALSATAEFQLMMDGVCKNLGENCNATSVQENLPTLQNKIEIPATIIRIIVAGKLGQASDIYGRKPILIFTIVASTIGKSIRSFVFHPSTRIFHSNILIAGDALASVGGSIFTFLALSNSYVSDVVEENMRSSAMSITVACFYIGFGLGPTIGSSVFLNLLKFTQYQTLITSVLFHVVTLAVTILFLSESRSLKARRKSRRFSESSRERRKLSINSRKEYYESKIQEFVSLFTPLKKLWITRYNGDGSVDLAARYNVLKLVAIDFILCTSTMGLSFVFVLYTSFKFQWTSEMLGYFMGAVMISRAFMLFVFAPWLQHFLKKLYVHKEEKLDNADYFTIAFSALFDLLGLFVVLTSKTSGVFFTGGVVAAIGCISTPAIHSAIAKYSSVDGIGELFGALALNRNFVNLIMPVVFQITYSKTVESHPRTAFVIANIIVFLGLLISLSLRTSKEEESQSETNEEGVLPTAFKRPVRKPSVASIARTEALSGN